MSGSFTPGPWRAVGPDVFDADDGLVVSLTNSWKRDKASRERDIADPLLIAAAPDPLEASVALERNTVELYRGIAPSGNYGSNASDSDNNENTFADADPVVVAARAAIAKATGA